MDIHSIKDSMSRRGVSVTIGELAYRAANKVTDVRILCAMTLTPATVDPSFLAAARKHLLAHWRYAPATEDGRAIASSTVITLRFELQE